jgi:hypothetical protein
VPAFNVWLSSRGVTPLAARTLSWVPPLVAFQVTINGGI